MNDLIHFAMQRAVRRFEDPTQAGDGAVLIWPGPIVAVVGRDGIESNKPYHVVDCKVVLKEKPNA